MTTDRTLPRALHSGTAPQNSGSPEGDSGGILEQAKAFSQVARAAYNDCRHGQDAVDELRRRRNRPGQ